MAWRHICDTPFDFVRESNKHTILWPASILIILNSRVDNNMISRKSFNYFLIKYLIKVVFKGPNPREL